MESLHVTAGGRGLAALLTRAVRLDADASARFQARGADNNGRGAEIDVFVTTPFDCFAARRVAGEVSRSGAAVGAADLLAALKTGDHFAGPTRDASWPGALPPAQGFTLRDTVPVGVAVRLAEEGQRLARQFSGPLGPPASLMNQVVLTADADAPTPVEIPMRMIFACTSLGLIPTAAPGFGESAELEVPRHLRVSTAGRWIRIDAPFGTVYRNTGLGVLF